MIEFDLIDDTQTIDVNLTDNSETIEVDLIKEIDRYDQLKNKPSINNVTLEGNKTLSELGIQPEGDYATNTYVNTELNKKVDKVDGKGLSTNDFTDIYKSNVDSNTSARHTHSNKTVLDGISSEDISNWDNKSDFSGDYNDLTNKPTIPSKTSDLTNNSGFITNTVDNLTNYTLKTNTGSLIDLEINTTNYVVTLSLKDQDGTVISTDSIDLPLESVVVGGSYDSENQKIVLTLENGNTVDIPVGALVSGLQTEITSDNKLDSDLVDDSNSGNKFVTTSEKTTWNNKLDSADLTNYVTNTDYASSSTAGVIKLNASGYGTSVDSSGALRALVKNYEQYESSNSNYIIGKGTLENVITGKGLITSSSDITGNASTSTTLKAFNYSRKGTSNTWAKVATATLVGTWEEKHAYLFVKGTHNSNFKQNGIISIDVVGNATKSKVNSYSAQFISASTDLNVENFYIEYQDGDANTNATINFWVRNTTNTYASWQFKILQNTGWTIESADTSVTTLPTQYFTGKNAELNNISLKAINDKDGNDITTTYAKNTDYATTSTAGLMSSTDKTKLNGIATGAEVNVQSNWNEANSSSDAYIQNKPYIPKYYYGTCSTKNTTRAKVVVCPDFVLEEGATISVLFTAAQTYNGAPYLNVNDTGSITVQYKSGTSGIRYMWNAGAIIDFTYNGTYWIMHRSDLATTTYYGIAKYSESLVSTSASYALTPSAMNKAMINIISGTPVYSSSATYNVGDKVRYTDNVWRCTTAIETAEAWDETHWEIDATLQDQIYTKQDTLVSGTNIKTVNNNSLVGSGNVSVGTITGITMNGSSKGTSGVVDLGTVITQHQDISGKQNITDNTLDTVNKTIPTAINEVNSIAKGANQAVGYANYSAMVTAINAMDDEEFSMGQNIYIVTVNVPDLWVSSVESSSSTYTYVDDATIVSALETDGYIQVGYYKLSMLETQKVDLTNYVTNTDYATSSVGGVVKVNSSRGASMTNAGTIQATINDYTSYQDLNDQSFIGKGTLENVITGKGLGTYSKPSGGIPSTDLDSSVQTSLGKADGSVQLSGGSTSQTISLTSGTGTTALGLKSMSSTSSYISFSNPGGWLGSYGVSSDKKPVFYNGTGYQLAYTTDIPKMVTLTQSDYDDLVSGGTVDADTYYFIEES